MSSVFSFTGDVMLGRGVNEYLKKLEDKSKIWGDVLEDLRKSDLVFINLECAITNVTQKGRKDTPVFFFRSNPENIKALVLGNVSYCCCANNHILDFGEEGLRETLKILDLAKIKHSGAGENIKTARKPAELKVDDQKLKVFAFSDNERGWQAKRSKPGINYIPIDTRDERFKKLIGEIKEAKQKGFLVIVSAHWGPNMVRVPPKNHIDFAHKLIDAGVDIFHGHSSHVFQPIEIYNKGVIFYDCGEFLDDYAVDPILRNDESFLFQVVLKEGKIQKVVLKPIKIVIEFEKWNFLKIFVKRAKNEEARLINQKMLDLSKGLVPKLSLKKDYIEINLMV